MRAHELVTETKVVQEIERLSKSGYEGGKEELTDLASSKTIKNLPGGSGLKYSIQHDGGEVIVKIWDVKDKGEYIPIEKPQRASWHTAGEHRRRLERWEERNKRLQQEFNRAPGKLIAQLTLHPPYSFPLKNALQVGTITVDEDYRGVGLAKALYGIVLTIMKRPLLAGTSQTPGGRRNWVSLSRIPGVEMKGYVTIDDSELTTTSNLDAIDDKDDLRYAKAENRRTEKRIDIIMGKLGGQYIGSNNSRHYFAFDVQPNTTEKELKAYINTNLSKVYQDWDGDNYTGLMAVWTGK